MRESRAHTSYRLPEQPYIRDHPEHPTGDILEAVAVVWITFSDDAHV